MKSDVCVVGLGYMGLPMAAIIANSGLRVIGVDLDEKKINSINKGKCPFDEKGMPEVVKSAILENGLIAQRDMPRSHAYIISVPTPVKNKKCDLIYVLKACESISKVVEDGDLVIVESTIKPNTCKNILAPAFNKVNKDVLISYCPERAIPGNTIYELVHNDRIIGGLTKEATLRTYDLYRKFIKGEMHLTDVTTAESCKLMENTFRDVNIALANEFSEVLEEFDVNPWEAIRLANKHPRVNILSPGPGVGGHCIAVDPWFLCEDSDKARLIIQAREINDKRPLIIVDKVMELSKKYGNKVGILGVAYKKDVDDCRESPASIIIHGLEKNEVEVKCSDPYARNFEYQLSDQDEVLDWADIIVLVTDHTLYGQLKLEKPFLDTRNMVK